MRKKLAAGMGGLIVLFCLAGAVFMTAYKTRALRFVSQMGSGINLGNTLDATGLREYKPDADELEYETYWGNPKADAETFLAIKKAGFGTVRIPVTWEDHLDVSYQISDVWMDRVQEVVDMALAADLYVIINLHHEEWLDLKTERAQEIRGEFAVVWEQIAARFRDYDETLLFEAVNEPRLRGGEVEWTSGTEELRAMVNDLNAVFVETVRASGGGNRTRYLLISPYAGNCGTEAMQGLVIPDDGRLIVSVHMYTPYSFCQKEDGEKVWDNAGTREQVEQAFFEMYRLFVERHVPVILTEFGCVDKGNTQERLAWTGYYMEQARRYGISCIWWDCGGYALLDRENKTWRFPEIVEVLTNEQM